MQISLRYTMQMACVQKLMDCLQSFTHQKIRKERNMPIYCHFLSKSEYQFEKNLIKQVAFSALYKNVSPLFNDNLQVPSGGAS